MNIIVSERISKHYGKTRAAHEISINVKKGEIYGFLGLNGAGKTTVIRMLLCMIKPAGGTIHILGEKVSSGFSQWNKIGYMVETPNSYPQLTVVENLKVFYDLRELKDINCIQEVMETLKLTQYKNKKAGELSMGNLQRLGLAKALLHSPEILILDEPINGLDPEGIVEVRELLKTLSANGVTILLSSHILGEISRIANRIGIIHEGVLVQELETYELTNLLQKKLIVSTKDNESALSLLAQSGFVVKRNEERELELHESKAWESPEVISEILASAGLFPTKILLYSEDLEMFFLRTIRN